MNNLIGESVFVYWGGDVEEGDIYFEAIVKEFHPASFKVVEDRVDFWFLGFPPHTKEFGRVKEGYVILESVLGSGQTITAPADRVFRILPPQGDYPQRVVSFESLQKSKKSVEIKESRLISGVRIFRTEHITTTLQNGRLSAQRVFEWKAETASTQRGDGYYLLTSEDLDWEEVYEQAVVNKFVLQRAN